MTELVTIYRGLKFTVCCIRGTKADADLFMFDLPEQKQEQVFALIRYCADNGPPRNEEKCRSVRNGLFELKSDTTRIPMFYLRKRIVLTHAFKKPSKKQQDNELKYAAALQSKVKSEYGEEGQNEH